MKNIIVGTAGHIDHGKTALVKALTGIDADRWEEEKRRGITIDLGFAHLQLTPNLRLGFVDVPGHERFVKNMLAGAGGMDVVLFVIAADESIKPQTREHFEICRLLGIRRGIIVLTKADLVDADILGLVRMEAEELAAGSFLEGAPVVAVSAVTGAGLDELRRELERVAAEVTEKSAQGAFRLPVDRVFTVKGFGTVATGTLISGAVAKEQEVELYPLRAAIACARRAGAWERSRTRGGGPKRTAVNLAGIEPAELGRGDVLSEPGRFRAVKQIDCRIDLLASAKPLKHRAPVHFHTGTAEIEAEVRLLQGATVIEPGRSGYARVVLREAALILPGDRFIIRKFSPVVTIGGGVAIDAGGESGTRRYRKGEDVKARLDVLAGTDTAARIALLVRESAYGIGEAELVARTGLGEREIVAAAAAAGLRTIPHSQAWFVDPAWMEAARERMVRAVREFHKKSPLLPGVARQELRAGAPVWVLDALLAAARELVAEGELVRAREHKLVLKEDEEIARARIERTFEEAGLAVPALAEVLAQAGVEASRARSLLQILLREKKLVKVSEDLLFHRSAVEKLRGLLREKKGERFSVGEFKEWTGISRKYAIPLLELLDRESASRAARATSA